jgi:hypothetical protein
MGSRWVHASKEIGLMPARQVKEESERSTTFVREAFLYTSQQANVLPVCLALQFQ